MPDGIDNVAPAQAEPVAPVEPAQVATPEPAAETASGAQLEVKDRTQNQFDKLLESNKRLYEANELLQQEMRKRVQSNQSFESFNQAPQAPVNEAGKAINPSDFIETDPTSGEKFVNEQKLQSAMDNITQRATRAEQAVNTYIQQAERREVDRQNREAFTTYPELDPTNPDFDYRFHNQTRAILLDSFYNPQDYGGKNLSFKDAAEFIKQSTPAQLAKIEKKAEAEVQPTAAAAENQALKEQGSLSASNQPQQQMAQPSFDQELADLRVRTRYGDNEALARRILNTDHTFKDEA